MRDQEPRRHHRHDEEESGCQRPGGESRRHGENEGRPPRGGGRRRGAAMQMRALTGQLAMAASQVAAAGTDAQRAQAGKILADSRKSLYQILADSEDEASAQEK